jgi:glyoxylase-like metal-dependent hydrolase (beta-lactamase superfamily II)
MQITTGLHGLGNDKGGYVRSYLLEEPDGLTLIDTLDETDGSQVFAAFKSLGRQAKELKRIILSHAHPSHLGGLATLKAATGAVVYSHEWEADIIAGRRKMVKPPSGLFPPQRPFRLYKFQVGAALGLGTKPFCEVDRFLKDGDHVGSLTVLHAPGHTPGSLAFWWPDKRALIAGDIVTTWPEVALGWPQITLDNDQNRKSVGKLTDIVQAEIVGVGHGDAIRSGGADVMRDLVHGKSVRPDLATA